MRLVTYSNAFQFYEKVKAYLYENECENNLPIGMMEQALHSGNANNYYMACVSENSFCLAVLLQTPKRHLMIISHSEEAVQFAVKELLQLQITFPGVIGKVSTVNTFVQAWHRLEELHTSIQMEQGIYQLDKVTYHHHPANGQMITAQSKHLTLLSEWIYDFINEVGEQFMTKETAFIFAKNAVENQTIYLWSKDGQPVAMAKKGRTTKNGAVVSLVYTPTMYRKNGYASSLVSFLSEKLLKEYAFCTLYTDLSNPTSNKIYQQIGYKQIAESVMLDIHSI